MDVVNRHKFDEPSQMGRMAVYNRPEWNERMFTAVRSRMRACQ